nr:hypothetical protein [Tanacetum cinerariifolium]
MIKNDGIVNRLKFVRIREDYKKYGLLIPDMMLNDKIKQLDSYQMFLKYSTGLIPPKKSRGKGLHGKKTVDVSQESINVSDESEPEPAKKKTSSISTRGVVIQNAPSAPKSKPATSKLKHKGVQSLTPEEQEVIDTMQALKESKKTSKRQSATRGLSKGTGRILEVPDESTVISATLSEGTGTKLGVPDEEKVTSEENVKLEWGSEHESKQSEDSQLMSGEKEKKDNDGDGDADDEDEDDDHIMHKDVDVEMVGAETVERENKEKDEMTDAAQADVEKTSEEKDDAELSGNVMISEYEVKESTELLLPSS